MRQRPSVSDIPDAWIPQRSTPLHPNAPSIPEAWIPRPPRGMQQQTGPRGGPGGPGGFGGPREFGGPGGPRGFGGPGGFGGPRGFGGFGGPGGPRGFGGPGGPRGFGGPGGPGGPRGPRGFGGPNMNVQPTSSSTEIPDAWIPSKVPDFVQFQNEPFSPFRNPHAPKRPVVSPVVTKDSTSPIVQNTPITLSTLLETIEDPIETNYSETISMLQNLEQGTYDDVRDIIENPTGSLTIHKGNETLESEESEESEYEEIEVEVTDDDADE